VSVLPVGFGSDGGAAPGYTIDNSLRFRNSASAELQRTPTTNDAAERRTWTWSGWVKRGALGVAQFLFSAGNSGGNQTSHSVYIDANGKLSTTCNTQGMSVATNDFGAATAALLRDPTAWYHLVVVLDATQATASDRLKFYVNGAEQAYAAISPYPANPTLDFAAHINSNIGHAIGDSFAGTNYYFDGYLAEVHFVTSQALTPSDFGQLDSAGTWQPKAYAGTYGTNGYYLKFNDATSLTTLAEDRSGNGNNWTATNISLTAGATYDWMSDTPSNNFPTWNPLFRDSVPMNTIADGGLSAYSPANPAGWQHTRATQTIPPSGKWYWEWTLTQSVSNGQGAALSIGNINRAAFGNSVNNAAGFAGLLFSTQTLPTDQRQISKMSNGSNTAYAGQIPAVNDVFSFAYDASTGKYWHGRNGVWYDSGDPAAGTNPSVTRLTVEELSIFQGSFYVTTPQYVVTPVNFGQQPFAYAPPTGFVALCTANLPAPAIRNPRLHFDIKTRVGTAASANITGYAFQPDLVWIKSRGRAIDHALYDRLRGAQARLESNQTDAEVTSDDGLTAFNSDGYTLGTLDQVNGTPATNSFVDWAWRANGSGVANTDGTIASTVSVNTAAGISVVAYTGTGSAGTVGHGLGAVPKMVIAKRRNSTGAWPAQHADIAAANSLYLNTTAAAASASTIWNNTKPSSSVFSIGTSTDVNANASTYVALCFAEVPGFSRIASYVGNGNVDGPFVWCGFRPAFVLIKRRDSDNAWRLTDSRRSAFNVVGPELFPNTTQADLTDIIFDYTANGFKIRSTFVSYNASGGNYIFLAFAEDPFKHARAR
jgi:hypothetical protein